MAANGVIGITAQIMESSDLTGGKEQASPSMSIFQRIAMGLRNIKKGFKSLVKNKSTGLLWLLLGSSQIARSLLSQVMKMVTFMLDILLASVLPVINWILVNISKLINVIDTLLQNLEKWFKEIFDNIWNWVRDHAVSLWPGLAEAFGWEAESINVDAERDDLLIKLVPEISQVEVEDYMTKKLVDGAPIDPSYWDTTAEVETPTKPVGMGFTDAEAEKTAKGELSWIYAGGAPFPPGGYIDEAIQKESQPGGDIKLIDEEIGQKEKDAVAEAWFSWADEIVPFGWNDILDWAKDSAEDLNITPEDMARYLFGTWESTSGEDAICSIIDKSVSGETIVITPEDIPVWPNPGASPRSKNPQGSIDMQLSNLNFTDSFS